MDQFAVFRITKFKKLGGIGAHIDRQHISANVDKAKTGLNEELNGLLGATIDGSRVHLREEWADSSQRDLKSDVKARIASGYTQKKAIRKDAVLALGVIMTGSHERMKEIEDDPPFFDAWKQVNYDFACHEFGKENIVRFTLHRDEKTPHFHCVLVPITPQGGLSAKYFTDGGKQLKAYQDRYAEAMQPFGLARGISKELTKREHVTTEEYYREVNNLARASEEVTEGVKRSNLFQLDAVRHKLHKRITQLKITALHHQQQAAYVNQTNKQLMSEDKRAAYIARRQEENKQALDWVKKEVSLVDFATSRLGWQINKQKSSKRDVVLKHEQHGVIIAPSSPLSNSGYRVFSWAGKQGGGTLVDLLLLEGWDWKEIRALSGQITAHQPVAALSESPPIPPPENHPEKQTELAQSKFNSLKPQSGPSYLDRRGIDPSIYEGFKHFKTNDNQAIFKLYKVLDDGRGHLCSTISYYYDREGKSKKHLHKGLPRGVAVFRDAGPIDRLVVTESPVDALSFRQVEALKTPDVAPGTMYVSTCGSLSSENLNSLQSLFKQAREEGRYVIVARDNDEAGKKTSRDIALLARSCSLSTRVSSPPQGKDWNEYLVQLRGEMREEISPGTAVQQVPLDHSAPAYKGTVLEKLGLPEAGCKVLSGYVATEDHVSFPLYAAVEDMKSEKASGLYQVNIKLTSRYEMQGTSPGLVVLPSEKPASSVVITDHPLEIFLHRESIKSVLPNKSTTYISTCGQDAREVQKPLKAFLEDQKCTRVTLSMPSESADKLQSQLGNKIKIDGQVKSLTCRSTTPVVKASWHPGSYKMAPHHSQLLRGRDQEDWVEAREVVKKESVPTHGDQGKKNTVNKAIAVELQPVHPIQKSLHKTPAYKDTLLETLSLSDRACKSLQGYEASEKQLSFPLYSSTQAVKDKRPTGAYELRLEEKGLESYATTKSNDLVVLPNPKAQHVVITTDPMDIFLHRAEQQTQCKWPWKKPPATTYISTCGQEVTKIREPLQALLDEHQGKSVLLYMNDKEAQGLQKQLMIGSEKTANYAVKPPPKSLWHPELQQATYDLQKIMRQDQEQWEPIKPKRRKGKGNRVRAV